MRNRMLEFCTSGSVGGLGGRPPRPTRTIVRLFIVVRLELMTKQCGFQTEVLTAEKTSESLLLTTKRLFSLDIVVVRQPGDPPRLAQAAVLGAVGLNDIHSSALDPGLKRLPTRQHLAPGDWYGRDLSQCDVALQVIGRERLLEPDEPVIRQHAGRVPRPVRAEGPEQFIKLSAMTGCHS